MKTHKLYWKPMCLNVLMSSPMPVTTLMLRISMRSITLIIFQEMWLVFLPFDHWRLVTSTRGSKEAAKSAVVGSRYLKSDRTIKM